MPRTHDDNHSSRALTLVGIAVVIAVLYFAQEILLPFALAVLLTFVLSPLAGHLERLKLGRIPSVIVAVALAFAVIGAIGWVVTNQLIDLAANLPEYQDRLVEKIRSLRGPVGGASSEFMERLREFRQELTQGSPAEPASAPETAEPGEPAVAPRPRQQPVPVQIVETSPLSLRLLRDWAGPLLAPLGTVAIIIVFVIFMLLKREDLRDRLIRLFGTGQLYVTTQALDDAAARVSRYLLMQLVVNATYGTALAIGLFFIGLPNALLWGLLAAVFRFVPYVGPWIAAIIPIALSLVVSEGWTVPLLTVGLFVVLELVSNNVMEPWLYGASTGVSAVGIIVAATFWTWLWGPIGLVLSTPLTVCLTVLGRHVPRLNFLNVLLSDEPALELKVRFYQRLLALDYHEANDLVADFLKTGSVDDLYERMLIPALSLAERDRHAGRLAETQQRFIYDAINDLIDQVEQQFDMAGAAEAVPPGASEAAAASELGAPSRRRLCIVCVPAEDEADQIAGRMLVGLLSARGHAAEVETDRVASPEMPQLVGRRGPDCVVISAVAPGGAIQARNGSRQLRPKFPDLKIIAGLWDANGKLTKTREQLSAAGVNVVTTSVSEGLKAVQEFARPISSERQQSDSA